MNVKVEVSGPKTSLGSKGRGSFLVSNHLGYIDGLVLGATFPLVYVSKSELKKWPLIGLMSEVSGTLFVDRQKKNHVREYIEGIAGVLKEGTNILFFPEGTSTGGERLLPFKSAFFEAPLKAQADILPISMIYRTFDGQFLRRENRDLVYWYGDMTFADHFFKFLMSDGICAEVRLHQPIAGNYQQRDLSRKRASELASEAILADIHLIPSHF